jgi:Tfp pilus assembly protein PilO
MSEITLMAETIHDAMQAVEEAHIAAKELKQKNDTVKFDEFRAKMAELEDHLTKLKKALDNEEAYAMDELLDALSKSYSGHRAEFRKTERVG